MPQTKQQIRKAIADKRKIHSSEQLRCAGNMIAELVCGFPIFHNAQTIALYMAIGGEVQLDSLFSTCWDLGKRTCIPVFNAQTKLYEMAKVTAETEFKTGNYGIKEPKNAHRIPMHEIDLILVPGVAYSEDGKRLGRGGGYYDRLLDGYRGTTIGVALDEQIVEGIPCNAHDQPVNYVITPSKTFIARNER
ncbi:MAG: 5-formyltetrahydrofolate cyclo-ligase [Pontiellaceae bacterium]|nr:5-formyltetrahydrofolate cyclo-ligase [Pontiellaceae bacterium]